MIRRSTLYDSRPRVTSELGIGYNAEFVNPNIIWKGHISRFKFYLIKRRMSVHLIYDENKQIKPSIFFRWNRSLESIRWNMHGRLRFPTVTDVDYARTLSQCWYGMVPLAMRFQFFLFKFIKWQWNVTELYFTSMSCRDVWRRVILPWNSGSFVSWESFFLSLPDTAFEQVGQQLCFLTVKLGYFYF